MKRTDYKEMNRRIGEGDLRPIPQAMIDEVVSRPRQRTSDAVPLRRWPAVVLLAAVVGSAGLFLLRGGGEQGVLVAENQPVELLSRGGACPVSAETMENVVPQARRGKPRLYREAEIISTDGACPVSQETYDDDSQTPVRDVAPSAPAPDPEFTLPSTFAHPAEQILCYRDGVLVDCQEESVTNTIMSFLS